MEVEFYTFPALYATVQEALGGPDSGVLLNTASTAVPCHKLMKLMASGNQREGKGSGWEGWGLQCH